MLLENRIEAFSLLGEFLNQFTRNKINKKKNILYNDLFFDAFKLQIKRAKESNSWFTDDNVLFAFESWASILTKDNLNNWVSKYNLTQKKSKVIAVIMAGNIPLVGFHDFLTVLISGNTILVKQSSNDSYFLPLVAKYLEHIESNFKGKIRFTEGKIKNFDAVIATGSNNTARYFDYYFGKHPHIIRQNRNAVAVLTNNESIADLENLGDDIFRYFGLGCRSVSKIFVPKAYNFDLFFNAIYKFKDFINYQKYDNNYTYNKTVYLMSLFKLLENGFLMLKEDASYSSPIATLFYEYYTDLEELKLKLRAEKEQIQVVVSNARIKNSVRFGKTQQPQLNDYADGVDTLAFLIDL
ncbi:MAG: acyl-CoA reductase [Flavobacteriaceae bacterium]|nr:acyl-CoA reductase [Flavobacteriaceae bacterium]